RRVRRGLDVFRHPLTSYFFRPIHAAMPAVTARTATGKAATAVDETIVSRTRIIVLAGIGMALQSQLTTPPRAGQDTSAKSERPLGPSGTGTRRNSVRC